jgi:hypothetical protein
VSEQTAVDALFGERREKEEMVRQMEADFARERDSKNLLMSNLVCL